MKAPLKVVKTKIPPKIRLLARHFGVTLRVAKSFRAAKIYSIKEPKGMQAAYVGHGIVFVKDEGIDDLPVVLLHEIGHAVLDFFPLDITGKTHEIKANAIALAFAAQLRIPVNHGLIKSMSRFTRTTEMKMRRPK